MATTPLPWYHLSPLLVLAFTVERYVAVCHPFYGERISSTRRAVATTVILACIYIPSLLDQELPWPEIHGNGFMQQLLIHHSTEDLPRSSH